MNQDRLLKVDARSPFEVYFQDSALTVSGSNKVGKFDILPGHADFFSIINPDSELVIGTDQEDIRIAASNGIICVKDDQVQLFLNI
jgi:F0F1-type ATP synthase epsilon subunit